MELVVNLLSVQSKSTGFYFRKVHLIWLSWKYILQTLSQKGDEEKEKALPFPSTLEHKVRDLGKFPHRHAPIMRLQMLKRFTFLIMFASVLYEYIYSKYRVYAAQSICSKKPTRPCVICCSGFCFWGFVCFKYHFPLKLLSFGLTQDKSVMIKPRDEFWIWEM